MKLDVCFEDESETTSRCDLPSALDLFREARQNAYGILYNAKQKQIGEGKMSRAELDNSLLVKEWYTKLSTKLCTEVSEILGENRQRARPPPYSLILASLKLAQCL